MVYINKPYFSRKIAEIAQYDYSGVGTLVFPCIKKLLKFLDKFDMSDCFFRGQSGLWEVTSSLHRHYNSTERFQKACNISVSALEWLKNSKIISNVLSGNDDYAMAIAQHYGCPTDLIDITTNYRTAAYFATSNNKNHEETPEGCIWVFTKEDIKELQDILKTNFFDCFNKLPQSLQDKLTENYYSQLLQIDIPQLSRLNAQKGAFLWDICGLLKQQLRWRIIGTQFVFKHIPDEKNIFTEDEGKLFPFPNQLESEVMRIFREKNRTKDGLPDYYGPINNAVKEKEGELINGIIPELAEKAKESVYFELPDFFIPSFGEYPWSQRTITQNGYNIKNIDKSNYIECHLPFSELGTVTLVQHILKNIRKNSLTDLLILFYKDEKLYAVPDGDEEVLIDLVITLDNYLYSDMEIANIVLEWMKMLIFKSENGYTTKTEDEFEYALIWGHINDWVTKYYGCKITKLTIGEGKAMSKFWLPENYIFLEKNYINEFSTIDKDCFEKPEMLKDYYENIPDNAKIFLYQHKPQRIMTYETMKRMFIELILPQLFAFRRVTDRVYIPDYIDKISLPVFGQRMFGLEDPIQSDDNYGGFIMV